MSRMRGKEIATAGSRYFHLFKQGYKKQNCSLFYKYLFAIVYVDAACGVLYNASLQVVI